jgi:hypothetical protein
MGWSLLLLLGLGSCLLPEKALSAEGQSEAPPDTAVYLLEPYEVRGRIDDLSGIASTASEGRVGIADIRLRPMVREAEVLETVPGMIATQHSGDGKSNQMFLRGFNLDHGTDFRTVVDGMPINLPTNAHGQGYTDVNFLIPELVDFVEFRKGTYFADVGDFGSAGAAFVNLATSMPRSLLKLEVGEFDHRRLLGVGSLSAGPGDLLLALELKGYDGPWEKPQNLEKRNGQARYTWQKGSSRFSLLGMGYSNRWDSSDQIPRRAVEEGLITRFGQVDRQLGGESSRYSVSGNWHREGRDKTQRVDFYGIRYELDLISNFTYLLDDTLTGDQFEQTEKRTILGGGVEHGQTVGLLGRDHFLSAGFETRWDVIDGVGLYRTDQRQRVETIREDDVWQSANGLYAGLNSVWHPKVRTWLGLRGDLHYFNVTSLNIPANSGDRWDGIITPKLSVVLGPWIRTEFYVNAGMGFHSNDARGTTIRVDPATGDPTEPVDPLVLSRGLELGLRLSPLSHLRSTLSVWGLELDSELLYVGDAGGTEASDKSRRIGLEFNNYYRPWSFLALDLDLALSHARFVGVPEGEDRIPGALENVLAAGVTLGGENGPFGSLRVRHFGEYPLIEDNSVRAQPTTLLNAGLGYMFPDLWIDLRVLNILDVEDYDIQYFYTSRLPDETLDGVDDIHVHPVEPRQIRGSVTLWF